jgi:molybdopterin molybdotransferase
MGNPARQGILSFEEARHLVEGLAAELRPRGRELVTLLDAHGRILAEAIHADREFPPFPRAARDGYAVRAGDLGQVPAELQVIGEVRAGSAPDVRIGAGKAVSIMTGAAVPPGADAVVMMEHTSRDADRVHVERRVAAGENIVPAGSEGRRGDQLLAPGIRVGYAEAAMAAAAGRSHIVVFGKPRIAVLSTGDEVIDVDVPPGPAQIRNSNSYSLAVQIQQAGGEASLLPIAPDEPVRLRELLKEGIEADLLLIAGGVSMGKYDLVEEALAELHAEFFFTGVQIQPGKPVMFGRVHQQDSHKFVFGLPGNPISTMVTFELFARPMVEALAGLVAQKLAFVQARLKSEIRTKTGLKRFLPGLLSGEFENSAVELVKWQGSGDIGAVTRANCFVVLPSDRERIAAGEWVSLLLR